MPSSLSKALLHRRMHPFAAAAARTTAGAAGHQCTPGKGTCSCLLLGLFILLSKSCCDHRPSLQIAFAIAIIALVADQLWPGAGSYYGCYW